MLRSTAVVTSTTAHRDGEELLALLGDGPSVRIETAHAPATCLVFPYGIAGVLPRPGGLTLIAAADDATALGHVEDVLARAVATVQRGSAADVDWHFASADDRAVRLAAA